MRGSHYYEGDSFNSSFVSCEKDAETIIKRLFVDSKPYSDELIRLLVINSKDCLDNKNNIQYKEAVQKASPRYLMEHGYIRLQPRLLLKENQEVQSYLLLSFDNFQTSNFNPHYRDCVIEIDIICHISQWDLGNYRQRPLKIAGYIDGLLNNSKLSGIGELNFLTAKEIVLNEELAGYCLLYSAVHAEDDEERVNLID